MNTVSNGPPIEWGDSRWQIEDRKPQETLGWVLNLVKMKIKALCFLRTGPQISLLYFRVWQRHIFRNFGQRVFKELWSAEHDLLVFSMFTSTFWNTYITIYIKIKLWTAGQEHCSTRRTFFQVPWHRGLPIACQWRVWFLKWYFENVSYAKAYQRKF